MIECCHSELVVHAKKKSNGRNLLRTDPTKTGMIRQQFMADLTRRFKKFKRSVREFLVEKDALGFKERPQFVINVEPRQFEFATSPDKLKAFNDWVDQQIKENILSINPAGYVSSAYKRGLLNSYISAKASDPGLFEENGQKNLENFLQSAFNAPEALQKVQFLATRSYEQLKGVTAQMAADMNRILSQGMLDGSSVTQIAKQLEEKVDTLTAVRAMTLARTETVAAHAEGQLDGFERLGVKDLGVKAEWLTAGDLRVCPLCLANEGKIFSIEDARGMIPLHPNCRCSWTPYIPVKT